MTSAGRLEVNPALAGDEQKSSVNNDNTDPVQPAGAVIEQLLDRGPLEQLLDLAGRRRDTVFSHAVCQWCATPNIKLEGLACSCVTCGHRADLDRALCDCALCSSLGAIAVQVTEATTGAQTTPLKKNEWPEDAR